MMKTGWKRVLAVALVALAACSGGGGKDTTGQPDSTDARLEDQAAPDLVQDLLPDAPGPDGVPPDQAAPDAPEPDGVEPDQVTPDGPAPDAEPADDFGFNIRVPQNHSITCSNYPPGFPEDPMEQADVDWICTFDHGDQHGHIYVQSTPVDCEVKMGAIGIFECPAGYMSQDGKVEKLLNPTYNWGGGHNNDFLEFDWQGKHYKYYHSSFGFGDGETDGA
ncbi:MAG: hypothetical protein FJ109_13195, partial [Deltaproteobacteria bacterium]|nr:hypothetical protein [Deltaproteobacteria bacterium]